MALCLPCAAQLDRWADPFAASWWGRRRSERAALDWENKLARSIQAGGLCRVGPGKASGRVQQETLSFHTRCCMRNQIWEDKISAASRGHDLWRLDQTKLSISCVEWVVFGGHKTSAGHSRIQRSGKRAEELPERPDGPPSPSLICLRNTCWCWRCVQGSQKGDRAVEGKGVGVGRGIFEVNICLMWSRKF